MGFGEKTIILHIFKNNVIYCRLYFIGSYAPDVPRANMNSAKIGDLRVDIEGEASIVPWGTPVNEVGYRI